MVSEVYVNDDFASVNTLNRKEINLLVCFYNFSSLISYDKVYRIIHRMTFAKLIKSRI